MGVLFKCALLVLHQAVFAAAASLSLDPSGALHNSKPKVEAASSLKTDPVVDKLTVGTSSSEEDFGKVWQDVTKWMLDNKATVLPGIRSTPTTHGAFTIRGVTIGFPFYGGRILSVPKKLWIGIHSFPSLHLLWHAEFVHLPQCKHLQTSDITNLKVAVGMAFEAQKGEASFYAPYLRRLPQLDDYQAFLPMMASPELLKEFASLQFTTRIQAMQKRVQADKECFEEWHKQPNSMVGKLSWPEVFTALQRWQTRKYRTKNGEAALIPASDMMNTAQSKDLNTWWKDNGTHFEVGVTGHQSAGTELLDSYCPGCDNVQFLSTWGVYLEDNVKAVAPASKHTRTCASLYEVTHNALDTSEEQLLKVASEGSETSKLIRRVTPGGGVVPNGWRSPRCKTATLKQPQGPIRCSLARVAWESCAPSWSKGQQPGHPSLPALPQDHHTRLSDEEFVKRVSRMSIKHNAFDVSVEHDQPSL